MFPGTGFINFVVFEYHMVNTGQLKNLKDIVIPYTIYYCLFQMKCCSNIPVSVQIFQYFISDKNYTHKICLCLKV